MTDYVLLFKKYRGVQLMNFILYKSKDLLKNSD